MSTEYLVAAQALWGSADRALTEKTFALVTARAAPYKIEIAFEAFGQDAEQRLSAILDKHSKLFQSLQSCTPGVEGIALRWNGYGSGEPFLERVLGLLAAMGLADAHGQAMGDEGSYHCRLAADGLECEYVDLEP